MNILYSIWQLKNNLCLPSSAVFIASTVVSVVSSRAVSSFSRLSLDSNLDSNSEDRNQIFEHPGANLCDSYLYVFVVWRHQYSDPRCVYVPLISTCNCATCALCTSARTSVTFSLASSSDELSRNLQHLFVRCNDSGENAVNLLWSTVCSVFTSVSTSPNLCPSSVSLMFTSVF